LIGKREKNVEKREDSGLVTTQRMDPACQNQGKKTNENAVEKEGKW